MTEAVVVRTGTANLASVLAALSRVGMAPRVSESPADVDAAEFLVLPGVGAFGAAMAHLTAHGLIEPLRRRVQQGRPTLCICLGLQLLAEASEESPGVAGLGIIPGTVSRFPPSVRVPQLGWNRVHPDAACRILTEGDAYFANSYRLTEVPAGWHGALSHHGGPFVAALERGAVLACQFHPELSGRWGLALLKSGTPPISADALSPNKSGTPPISADALSPAGPAATTRANKSGTPCRAVPAAGGPAAPVTPLAENASSVRRRVIPCLDCRDGRVVKGVRFSGLRDAGSPPEMAAAYEAQGADELVLLDVSATPEGRATQVETVRQVREQLSIPLTVGGGVTSVEAAGRLLEAGADKVAVNTAAVRDPRLIHEIATRFGSQCAILALDAARREGGWEVVILSGKERTGRDAVAWAREAAERGAGEILLTSWDRDGTRAGYDTDLIRAVSAAVGVPVIASGGAAGPEHLLAALEAGADAVLAASIFHDGDMTVGGVKERLAAAGAEVRR